MRILRPIDVTDAVLISSSVPLPVVGPGVDPDPALWLVGTTYAVSAEVYHLTRRWRSRQAGNVGKTPATNPDWWLDLGPVNQRAMFDSSLGTITSAAESFTVVLHPTSYVDTVSVMAVGADTVRCRVPSSPYDVTQSMLYPRAVSNMYEYRFEPFDVREKALFTGLPVGAGAQIELTFSRPGGIASCGKCEPGLVRRFGSTEFGASVGIKDFGVKSVDKWGAPTMLEGAWADRMSIVVDVPNYLIDPLKRELTKYRSKPVVWIASDLFEATQVYGTFRDFSIVIPNAKKSKCSIEIEGFA